MNSMAEDFEDYTIAEFDCKAGPAAVCVEFDQLINTGKM